VRIALDAMGGDNAPVEIVKGALEARKAFPDCEIILAGDEAQLRSIAVKIGGSANDFEYIHASQVLGMDESPVDTLRRKKDSSVVRAAQAVASGQAEALVSAGNTGAVVALGLMVLGLLPGVKRPGIAVCFSSANGKCTVIDVGANLHCKPVHLLQYAIMAAIYHRGVVGTGHIRVGLMNVGKETVKGNRLTKSAYDLLKKSPFEFVGNVEGQDVFDGSCDVIVCEAFVGNVLLKFGEGLARYIHGLYRGELEGLVDAELTDKVAKRLSARTDYATYGGAPLLGVNGIVIICHGSSGSEAIKNAVKVAMDLGKYRLNELIVNELKRH